jgi:hypothetical protein
MGNPINLKGNLYSKVIDRLRAWRDDHPAIDGWSLLTEPISLSNEAVVFQVKIINPDGVTVATGHSNNILGRDKALEKAETVAIGRALATFNPKYGGEMHEFASKEEMDKFQENQVLTKDDGDLFPQKQTVQPTNGDSEVLWIYPGKYKDKPVTSLDQSYCTWALQNHEQLAENPQLRSAVEAHLATLT